jgi:chromosomal replication initiator protein
VTPYVFPIMKPRAKVDFIRRFKGSGGVIYKLTAEEIRSKVCSYYSVTTDEINGKSRKRRYVEPRQVAQTLIKRHTTWKLERIAEFFSRDHTSIMNSISAVNNDIETDEEFRRRFNEIQNSLMD